MKNKYKVTKYFVIVCNHIRDINGVFVDDFAFKKVIKLFGDLNIFWTSKK